MHLQDLVTIVLSMQNNNFINNVFEIQPLTTEPLRLLYRFPVTTFYV